jgi:hypothetical protein
MVPTFLVLTTFFSYGCTTAQRAALLKEGFESAKEYFAENAGKWKDAAVEAAVAAADKKIAEREAAELKALDSQLAQFPMVDAETGVVTVRTWKNFDENNNGKLEENELAKVAAFVMSQTAKKVAAGEMSKDEAGKTAKQTGVTLAALMALLLAKRGVDKFAKKPSGGPAASSRNV